MRDELHDEGDYLSRVSHPSTPFFKWVAEFATHEDVVWAIELSDVGRRGQLLELASRGPISDLDRASLARFAALVVVIQDRRSMGLV
jgi:hypothetical protein